MVRGSRSLKITGDQNSFEPRLSVWRSALAALPNLRHLWLATPYFQQQTDVDRTNGVARLELDVVLDLVDAV